MLAGLTETFATIDRFSSSKDIYSNGSLTSKSPPIAIWLFPSQNIWTELPPSIFMEPSIGERKMEMSFVVLYVEQLVIPPLLTFVPFNLMFSTKLKFSLLTEAPDPKNVP